MRKEACTATGEQIIFYGQANVMKKFTHSNVSFTNVFYIPTLMNNLYIVSCLYYWRWDINIKHSEETIFFIDNRVISYAEKI